MKKVYVTRLKEYETSEFDEKKVLAAMRRLRKARKIPTSVALEEKTINELKAMAEWRGVPYQVLMRMFILEGLRNFHAAGPR